MSPTSLAHLTCLCGAIKEPGTLLKSTTLPIHVQLCHCNPCRQTTGSTGASFPPLRSPPSQKSLDKLVSYSSSNILTRYFCATCGCKCFMWVHAQGNDGWRCLGGIIERDDTAQIQTQDQDHNEDPSIGSGLSTGHEKGSAGDVKSTTATWPDDTVIVSNHDYITDTLDGGIAPMLCRLNGSDVPLWEQDPRQMNDSSSNNNDKSIAGQEGDMTISQLMHLRSTPLSSSQQKISSSSNGDSGGALGQSDANTNTSINSNQFLPAKCHCGGVNMLLKRAAYAPDNQGRYIGKDRTKFLTFPCSCRSCRLSTGVSLHSFASVPPDHILNNDQHHKLQPIVFGGAAQQSNANPGQMLQHYWSSEDVCRTFCGKCGASVFYWNTHRSDEIDVAVGILRAEDGVMARKWLEWDWGRCSFTEECTDRAVSDAWAVYRE